MAQILAGIAPAQLHVPSASLPTEPTEPTSIDGAGLTPSSAIPEKRLRPH